MPEAHATLIKFVAEYERLCDMFCVKPERHSLYRDLKEFLNEGYTFRLCCHDCDVCPSPVGQRRAGEADAGGTKGREAGD